MSALHKYKLRWSQRICDMTKIPPLACGLGASRRSSAVTLRKWHLNATGTGPGAAERKATISEVCGSLILTIGREFYIQEFSGFLL